MPQLNGYAPHICSSLTLAISLHCHKSSQTRLFYFPILRAIIQTMEIEETVFFDDEDLREKARQAVAEGRLLDLKSDVVFKSFFSKDTKEGVYCRTKMISSVIGKTVKTATVLNPDILPDFISGKFPRLDIHCVLDDGSEIDVEMQGTKAHDDQIARSVYYAVSLAKSSVKQGMIYSQMPRVHQIMFMDFKVVEDEEFYHSYSFCDDKTGAQLSDLVQIHFIELPKLKSNPEQMSELMFWAMMVKSGTTDNTQAVFNTFPVIKEDLHMANTLLRDISQSEKEWWVSYESAERERNAYFNASLQQAEQRGMQQGQNQIIQNMLSLGKNYSEIAQLTGLSESQVRKICTK